MKTSYFGRANSKNFKDRGLNFVSIARSARYWSGRTYPPLFPTWDIINIEDEDEYLNAYYDTILSKLDPVKVYEDLGEDAIILCHEKYADIEEGKTFCHRHMVAKWLELELGKRGIQIDIEEMKDDKGDLKKMLKGQTGML